MPMKVTDFHVGDYIQLSKDNRRGYVRYIGRVKSLSGTVLGVELKDKIADGHDGTLGGKRHFECTMGFGTFVLPSRVKAIVKKSSVSASAKKASSSGAATVKKKGGSGSASVKKKGKSPRKKRPSIMDLQGGVPPAGAAVDFPIGLSIKEQVNQLLKVSTTATTKHAKRVGALTQFREIFENDDVKVDEADMDHAVTSFKKAFPVLLKNKKAETHDATFKVITTFVRKCKKAFGKLFSFYTKAMLAHLKHRDKVSVKHCRKSLNVIAKVYIPRKKLAALFAEQVNDKMPDIRRHALELLNLLLHVYVPEAPAQGAAADEDAKESEVSSPRAAKPKKCPKAILDVCEASVKIALKDRDAKVKKAGMDLTDTIGRLDEGRGDRLAGSAAPSSLGRQKSGPMSSRTSGRTSGRIKPGDTAAAAAAGGKKKPRKKGDTGKKGSSDRSKSTKPPRTGRKGKSGTDGSTKRPASTGPGRKKKPTDGSTSDKKKPGKKKPSGKGKKKPGKKKGSTDGKDSSSAESASDKPKQKNSAEDIAPEQSDTEADPIALATMAGLAAGLAEEPEEDDISQLPPAERRARHKKSRNTLSFGGGADSAAMLEGLFEEQPDTPAEYENPDEMPINASLIGLDPEPKIERDSDDEEDDESSKPPSETDGDLPKIDEEPTDDATPDGLDASTSAMGSTVKQPEGPSASADEPAEDGPDEDEDEEDEDDAEAMELIRAFLDLKEPQINWKMIEFLSKDNMTHLLMSYISRMPQGPKVWQANMDVDFTLALPESKLLWVEDDDIEDQANKHSYALMRILSNEHAAETVKAFLLRKCQEILLHSLAVYHPDSKGNVFHGRLVLEVMMMHWPKSFMAALANQRHIRHLLKIALLRNLHQGNLNSFMLELICYTPQQKSHQILPIKHKLLAVFSDWKFVEYLLDVSSSAKSGDDIATKYATFFIDLVARCACIEEATKLFLDHAKLIIDSFVNGLINADKSRTLWHRLTCGQTLVQFLDICSRPQIINPALVYSEMMMAPPEPSTNCFHQIFDECLSQLHTHLDVLMELTLSGDELAPIALAGGLIERPLGQVRLNTLELLTASADFAQFQCGDVLVRLPPKFWSLLVDMAFRHCNNNLFLCHFRRLVHLTMLFRRRFLRQMCENDKLVDRMVEFYTREPAKTSLHGYCLQMLWDMWSHDQRDDWEDEPQEAGEEDAPMADEDEDEDEEDESGGSVVMYEDEDEEEEEAAGGGASADAGDEDEKSPGLGDEIDEEFMMRKNFSDEKEDQWDILAFFESNEKFAAFKPILTFEISQQAQAEEGEAPEHAAQEDDQLGDLLTTILGPADEEDADEDDEEE